jgi:hypothetical protein
LPRPRCKPLLLLDVDGVLHPYPDTPDGYDEHAFFPEDDETVRLARVHGDWLRDLCRSFDVTWASGWGEEANRLLAPFVGLTALPQVPLPPIPFEPSAKVPAIAAYAAGRPAAWVDDLLGPEAHAWAATRREPTLLVEVDPAVGLTRGAVDELVAWANALDS